MPAGQKVNHQPEGAPFARLEDYSNDHTAKMDSENVMSVEDYLKSIPPDRRGQVRALIAEAQRRMIAAKVYAVKQVQDTFDVPNILYKYIPRSLLQHDCPRTLRATQLLALNDVMECNITTMDNQRLDRAGFGSLLQSALGEHLGVSLSAEEMTLRLNRYGDPRVSTVIQEYLNPFVGILSFSSDPLIPTMWAHYAQNSGFVVGYKTESLREMGFELRRMLYMEFAPTYDPARDNIVRLDFVDEELRNRDIQRGVQRKGTPILENVDFLELRRDWKALAPLLLVKGKSWEYEKEVRLLVDLQETRLLEANYREGWPIRVLDIPAVAIEEVYLGFNTSRKDVRRLIDLVGGPERSGWKLKYTSSHAYRMQVTTTSVY